MVQKQPNAAYGPEAIVKVPKFVQFRKLHHRRLKLLDWITLLFEELRGGFLGDQWARTRQADRYVAVVVGSEDPAIDP
jgi:hypothetical protein